MYKYNLSLIASARLLNDISDTDTVIQVHPGQGELFTQPPCVGALVPNTQLSSLKEAEHVIIRSRVGDALTVERGVIGTAGDYTAGYLLLDLWSPEHINHLYGHQEMVEFILKNTIGRGEANMVVDQPGESFDLSIVENLTVEVEAGSCFSNSLLLSVTTPTELTFTAPTTSTTRYIIQANPNLRRLSIKKGTEGVGTYPTADTDCLALWGAIMTVGMTELELADFTDLRPD